MLRSRGRKSLDLSGLQTQKYQKQGIYTFSLKNEVLLRNNAEIEKQRAEPLLEVINSLSAILFVSR